MQSHVARLDDRDAHSTGQRNRSPPFSHQITAIINPALDKYFPADGGVRVIAEPGRYYVASAYTLAVNIIAKKVIMDEKSASNGNGVSGKGKGLYRPLVEAGGGVGVMPWYRKLISFNSLC